MGEGGPVEWVWALGGTPGEEGVGQIPGAEAEAG